MILAEFLRAIGEMLAPIIEPILAHALHDAFVKFMEDTAVVGKENADLQNLWNSNIRPPKP